jgi:hypothetical protein
LLVRQVHRSNQVAPGGQPRELDFPTLVGACCEKYLLMFRVLRQHSSFSNG